MRKRKKIGPPYFKMKTNSRIHGMNEMMYTLTPETHKSFRVRQRNADSKCVKAFERQPLRWLSKRKEIHQPAMKSGKMSNIHIR